MSCVLSRSQIIDGKRIYTHTSIYIYKLNFKCRKRHLIAMHYVVNIVPAITHMAVYQKSYGKTV